jgi:hypothetical protein
VPERSRSHARSAGQWASATSLVRDYIRVDDHIVTERLKALGDLDDFVGQIAAFVTQN